MRLSSHALTMLLKAYRAVLTRSAKYLLIALPALVAENSLANQQLPPPPPTGTCRLNVLLSPAASV